MTPTVPELLMVQVTAALMLWALFFRTLQVPFGIKLLTVVGYVTVPVFFAVKGTQSAVYLSDFILPFLLVTVMVRGYVLGMLSNAPFIWLMILLVFLPLIFGLTYMSGDNSAGGFGARDIKGDLIWLYRNVTFLVLFGYGLSVRLSAGQFVDFVKMNLLLAVVLAVMGLLNYFGPFNLAFFDQMNHQQAFKDDYGVSRIGAGFMGLFRGSVGEWFATIVVLAAGSYAVLSPIYRKFAFIAVGLGVGIILLSYSRAGLIGACLGLILLGVFGSGLKQRLTALLGIGTAVGWVIWQSDEVLKRIATIYTGESAAGGRIGAWDRTITFFEHNQDGLLFGVGPTNREAVAHIAGTYGAHNEYLDVVFRFGISGFIVLIIVLSLLVLNLLRHKRMAPRSNVPIVNTVLVVLLINCVIGISQNHLMQDYSSYTMGFYLYLLYGLALGARWTEPYVPRMEEDGAGEIDHRCLGAGEALPIATSHTLGMPPNARY